MDDGTPAEQRLYDAVIRWNPETGGGLPGLIDAACQALIDGLDSTSLRELAGASSWDPSWEIRNLVTGTLDELGIAQPRSLPADGAVAMGGGPARRPRADALRLAVVPVTHDAGGGFQVEVHVNDQELTSQGAGLGMDPYTILIPVNRLVATPGPHTVPIARCGCGEYGCSSTDVTITRDGDRVHWDWSRKLPMAWGVSFAAPQYDAEVTRMAGDHSWESPERTAGRLVLTTVDSEALLSHGLTVSWVANDHRDPALFRVALRLADDYQIFVDTPWQGRGPEELAATVCRTLARGPGRWRASWRAITPTLSGPPTIARRSWRQEQFP